MKYTGLQYSDTSSSTLAGLKQDIYFLGKCNIASISDGDLNRIVNKYYSQLQEAVRAVNENFYMTVATTDLVIGDGSYNYPDGSSAPAYEKMSAIWAAFQPKDPTSPLPTEYRKIDCIDPTSISDPDYEFSVDFPKALMFGDYFVLLPLAVNPTLPPFLYPVTDGVKIYYIADQDKLINDTDVPKIFPCFHDAITQGALIDVHARLGNTTESDKSKKKFEERLEDIKSYASNRFPIELGIIEGQDMQGGWSYPFEDRNNSMS
jgi:hypothetical protein